MERTIWVRIQIEGRKKLSSSSVGWLVCINGGKLKNPRETLICRGNLERGSQPHPVYAESLSEGSSPHSTQSFDSYFSPPKFCGHFLFPPLPLSLSKRYKGFLVIIIYIFQKILLLLRVNFTNVPPH